MRFRNLAIALALGAVVAAPVAAQNYPTRAVRIIVGYPPGGGVDVAARIVAQGLSEVWGNQNAIIDNRPGAAGGIGTELTAKAAPDGYTLMLCQIASHAITPARSKSLPYDHIKDFSFVSMVGTTPNVIVTHPSLAMKNLRDVIAYAKKHPGKLNYGSSGVGASPNLSVELLKLEAKINIVHVPYKGAAPALADVIGGQIPLSVGNLPGGPLSAVKSGRLIGVGVTSAKRSARAPDVPTFAEGGVRGYDVSSWYGICAPAGLPKPVAAKLTAGLIKVLSSPDLKVRMEDQGIDVMPSTSEEFVAFVKEETAKWKKVVKEAGLVGDQ